MKKLCLALAMTLIPAGQALPADRPLLFDKAVFSSDASLSGTVVMKGQNVVKDGAVLNILPGSVIKFDWTDEDGDGIGDGELTVEGKLFARGTKSNPILFTSALDKPAPKDWTFVMISVSKESVLEYCIFEYAFTGVQIHYSTAIVRDCTFKNNFEGLRFSTTNVVIEHNDFLENGSGIRYESHGSPARITLNRFYGNDYAFFPAQRSSATVTIDHNNIEASRKYGVNVGNNQKEDLNFSHNWWGTADAAAIFESVYDKTKDPALGKIHYEPFLTAPVGDCGVRR